MKKRIKRWFKIRFHRCSGDVIATRDGNIVTSHGKTNGEITFVRCDVCKKVFATFENGFIKQNIPNPEYEARKAGISI